MATQNSIHVSEVLLAALEAHARAQGKTVDQLAVEAIRRHLAQQTLDRFKHEGDQRRGSMPDAMSKKS